MSPRNRPVLQLPLALRHSGTVLAWSLVLLAAASAHGDVLVLKNGRKLVGVIAEETEDAVILRRGGGTLRIALSQIKEIERGEVEEPDTPRETDSGRRVWDPRARGVTTKKKTDTSKRRTPGVPTLSELVAKLEQNPLSAWEDEAPSPVTESEARDYSIRLVEGGGRASYKNALPTVPQAGTKVYKKRKRRGAVPRGQPTHEWVRQHWDARAKSWTDAAPERKAFDAETQASSVILVAAARKHDAAAGVECQKLAIQMGHALSRSPTVNLNDERKTLREKSVTAVGSAAAGALFCQALEIGIDIMNAKPPRKVALCGERRKVLKRLAHTLGD